MSMYDQNHIQLYTNSNLDTPITYERNPTILEWAKQHKRSIWTKPDHIYRSFSKIEKFAQFDDYSERPISAFRASHIYSFLEHLTDDLGHSDATCNRYHSALNSVFKHYGAEYRCDIQPRVKWKKEIHNRPRYFTEEEREKIHAIFSKSSIPWADDFFKLSLKTGMRRGEVLGIGMSKDEVDTDQCYGKVTTHPTHRMIKIVHLLQTKNGDERFVPLCKEAERALEALDNKPSLHFNYTSYYDLWRYARDKICPGDKTFVPHVCRHTAGTTLASKKYNDTQIAKLLGHKSTLTTARYIHEDFDTTIEMVNTL